MSHCKICFKLESGLNNYIRQRRQLVIETQRSSEDSDGVLDQRPNVKDYSEEI